MMGSWQVAAQAGATYPSPLCIQVWPALANGMGTEVMNVTSEPRLSKVSEITLGSLSLSPG